MKNGHTSRSREATFKKLHEKRVPRFRKKVIKESNEAQF